MSQDKDPRQPPTKQLAGAAPLRNVGGVEETGGMHDDLDDARGATDDVMDQNPSDPERSKKRESDCKSEGAAGSGGPEPQREKRQ